MTRTQVVVFLYHLATGFIAGGIIMAIIFGVIFQAPPGMCPVSGWVGLAALFSGAVAWGLYNVQRWDNR